LLKSVDNWYFCYENSVLVKGPRLSDLLSGRL